MTEIDNIIDSIQHGKTSYFDAKKQLEDLFQSELSGYKEAQLSTQRLVKKIDVILCGDQAAKQASLCDLVSSIEDLKKEKDNYFEAYLTVSDAGAKCKQFLKDILLFTEKNGTVVDGFQVRAHIINAKAFLVGWPQSVFKDEKVTVGDLLKHFELLEYPSFGYGAITLYRGTGEGEDWQACLRNLMKWEHVPECRADNPKDALMKCYEYCVGKKYLPALPK